MSDEFYKDEVIEKSEEDFGRSSSLIRVQILRTQLDYIKRNYTESDLNRVYRSLGVETQKELDEKKYITSPQYEKYIKAIYNLYGNAEKAEEAYYTSGREFYKSELPDNLIRFLILNLKIDRLLKYFVRLACQYNKNFIYSCKKNSDGNWTFFLKLNNELRGIDHEKLKNNVVRFTSINTAGYVHGIADLKGLKNFKFSNLKINNEGKEASFDVNFKDNKTEIDKKNYVFISIVLPAIIFIINPVNISLLLTSYFCILSITYAYYLKTRKMNEILLDNFEKIIINDETSFEIADKNNNIKLNKNIIKLLSDLNIEGKFLNKKNIHQISGKVRDKFNISNFYFVRDDREDEKFKDLKSIKKNNKNILVWENKKNEFEKNMI